MLFFCCGVLPGQSLAPSSPIKEYIRINGQLIAIETNVKGPTGPSAGFRYTRTLSINASSVTADLTNFPVLFAATVPQLANVANGGHVNNLSGYDILFTQDAAGTKRLNWEIESYDPTAGTIWCWIQIPHLTHGVTTNIYLFYGNPAVSTDQSNRTGTWDGTFTAVYHFGASGFGGDSTAHNNAATVSGPVSGAGQIAQAASFANGGYFNIADSALLDSSTGTWEFWFKDDGPPVIPNAQPATPVTKNVSVTPQFQNYCAAVLTKADTHDSVNGIGFATCNGALFVQVKSATATTQTKAIYTTKGWHEAAFTYTSGGNYAYYGDGAAIDGGAMVSFTMSTLPMRIGLSLTPAWPQSYIGSLDEVRISNVVRPAAWMAAEHTNQASPSSFVTVGAETGY